MMLRRFQRTLPVRGVTGFKNNYHLKELKFQPTLPVRGVTLLHERIRH